MANVLPPFLITATGVYTFNVEPGRPYVLTLKGTYGGTTLTVQYATPTTDGSAPVAYSPIDNASYTGTGKTEDVYVFPTGGVQITATGGAGISVLAVLAPAFTPERR